MGWGSKAPDMSGVNRAAESNAAIAKEQLAFTREQWEQQKPLLERYLAQNDKVTEAQLASMEQNNKLAADYDAYNKGTFRPLEQGIVRDAESFDTAERRDAEAAAAGAGIDAQIAQQREIQQRQQASMGVNPNSGRAAALDMQTSVSAAAAKAGVMQAARKQVETQGFARRMDAASLGRGLASAQATSAGIALNAGNSAAGNAAGGLGQARAQTGMMQSGFSGAVAANQSAGNLYGQAAQIKASQPSAIGELGQAAGAAAGAFMMFSSKELKTDKKPVAGAAQAALDGIKGLKVEGWKYKKGVADEGAHVGPYAEDVQKTFGDEVAPGGKVIAVAPMLQKNSMALAALLEQVEAVEAQVAALKGKGKARSEAVAA